MWCGGDAVVLGGQFCESARVGWFWNVLKMGAVVITSMGY
jgi:hypothetical protein